MIIDELVALLGYKLEGEQNLTRFNQGLEKASILANRLATAMVVAGTIAGAALVGFGKGVVETSAQFEGFQTSLETIEGSSEKARKSMAWISQFGKTTPYEVAGITDAFIKLKSYGIDPMDETLRALGDTASAMNKPLNQAVEAFADAATFQFERLKEFGITSQQKGDEVTFSYTKNGKQLTNVVKKNGDDIRKFLLQNFGQRFGGAMERLSKTWSGMMSNLGDSWTDFKLRVGNAGFFDVVKNKLKGVLDRIGELDANGTLDRWAKRLSDVLTTGFNVLATVMDRVILDVGTIGGLLDQLGGKIADFLRYLSGGSINLDNWQGLIIALGALLAVLKPTWVIMGFVALALDDLLTYMRGGKSVIGGFIDALSEFFNANPETIAAALKNIGIAIAGLVVATKAAAAVAALARALGLLAAASTAGDFAAGGKAAGTAFSSGFRGAFRLGLAGLGAWAVYELMKDMPSTPEEWQAQQKKNKENDAKASKWINDNIGKPINGLLGTSLFRENSDFGNSMAGKLVETFKAWLGPAPVIENRAAQVTQSQAGKVAAVTQMDTATRARAAGFGSTTENLPGKAADDLNMGVKPFQSSDAGIGQKVMAALTNMNGHLAKMTGDAAAKAVSVTATDARQDNRQFPVTNNVTVNQTVQQAAQAPAAAAQATGNAVSAAAAKNAARVEGSPSF